MAVTGSLMVVMPLSASLRQMALCAKVSLRRPQLVSLAMQVQMIHLMKCVGEDCKKENKVTWDAEWRKLIG